MAQRNGARIAARPGGSGSAPATQIEHVERPVDDVGPAMPTARIELRPCSGATSDCRRAPRRHESDDVGDLARRCKPCPRAASADAKFGKMSVTTAKKSPDSCVYAATSAEIHRKTRSCPLLPPAGSKNGGAFMPPRAILWAMAGPSRVAAGRRCGDVSWPPNTLSRLIHRAGPTPFKNGSWTKKRSATCRLADAEGTQGSCRWH